MYTIEYARFAKTSSGTRELLKATLPAGHRSTARVDFWKHLKSVKASNAYGKRGSSRSSATTSVPIAQTNRHGSESFTGVA